MGLGFGDPRGGGSEAGARWVVLVEDDLAVAEMYRLGLELHGFRVTMAASGEELFDSVNGHSPEAIVLDYHLPVHNGAEVLERIRENARMANVSVFMLSNFPPSHEGAIDRVVRAGAIAWLRKAKTPPDVLAEKLAEALEPARGTLVRPDGAGLESR